MGATPSPPPTSTTVPSSLRIWLGRPNGPMKSRIVSPSRKVIISKVVLPTAWITTVTVPRSTLKSATVNGIRSPRSSMRAMMKCPGRAARATSGAWTSQRKVDGPNCFLRVMRNTTPPEKNTITELKSTIPDGLKLGARGTGHRLSWPVGPRSGTAGDRRQKAIVCATRAPLQPLDEGLLRRRSKRPRDVCVADAAEALRLQRHQPAALRGASGHGRHETDAGAGLHQGDDAGELIAFKDGVGLHAGLAAGGQGVVAEAVALAQQKHALLADFLQIHALQTGQSMSRRHGQQNGLAKQLAADQVRTGDRQSQDRQVQISRLQALDQARGGVLYQLQVHLRVLAQERGHARGNEIGHDGGDGADLETALHAGQHALHGVAGIGELAQDGVSLGKQQFAALGQAHRPSQALEQRCPHLGFELEDLLRERRLRHALFRGGPGKTTHARHGAEIAQLVHFHTIVISYVRKKYKYLLLCKAARIEWGYGRKENSHYGRRPPGRRQPELPDRGPPRARAHPGLPAFREDGALQPRADSRTGGSRQGYGRLRRLYRDRRHQPLYHRESLRQDRQEDRHVHSLLHRGRLFQPHLQPDQREERVVLLQVSLQDHAGHQELQPRRGHRDGRQGSRLFAARPHRCHRARGIPGVAR